MNDDPISKLPKPYRAAWEILQNSFDSESLLRDVLKSAQNLVSASWGMIILDTDVEYSEFSLPRFHALPEAGEFKIPVGYVTSRAYALAMKTYSDGQSELIINTNNISQQDFNSIIDKFLPPAKRKEIIERKYDGGWLPSGLLEIPNLSEYSIIVTPITANDQIIGAIYLHREISDGSFDKNILETLQTFISAVAICIKNLRDIEHTKSIALQYPYSISVDFKTPLITIRGFSELILKDLENLQDDPKLVNEIKKSAQRILSGVTRSMDILEKVTILARIEGPWFNSEVIQPNDEIVSIVEKYSSLIQEKNQLLELNIDETSSIKIQVNSFFPDVIYALIDNAYRYTPKKGKISILTTTSNKNFYFRISDTGYGLTEDESPNIFQRFYRSQREEIINAPGLGLGLYISKRLIERWGGQIDAEGLPNQGSTFWFSLPLAKE